MNFAEEIKINIDDTYMNVIKFGNGKNNLVVISGVAIKGLEGMGKTVAPSYRIFHSDFTVYIFERKHVMPDGYSVSDMADDIYRVCVELGIEHPFMYGVSQGGMIAQTIAINHPDYIRKLVLCSAPPRLSGNMREALDGWIALAESGDVPALFRRFFADVYSEQFLKKNKAALAVLERFGANADVRRFVILAKACETFDVYESLDRITCPILVLGDENDKIVDPVGFYEIAEKTGCEMYIYNTYSHAVYDEAPDIKDRIKEFLLK